MSHANRPSGDKALGVFLEEAIAIAESAGGKLFSHFRKERPRERGTVKEIKSVYDEVSDRIIKDAIEHSFPDHSYVTEETGLIEKGGDYLWIVDPLDGTSNFVNHNPLFSVSIALWHRGEPLVGVIEAPMLRERFVATRGGGAVYYDLLNETELEAQVSEIEATSQSYMLHCEGGESDIERLVELHDRLYVQAREVRKLGSAALELAWVGVGRSEAYMTTKISSWDIAAGVLFVKEAGGEILHLDGTPYRWEKFAALDKFDILATNGRVKFSF